MGIISFDSYEVFLNPEVVWVLLLAANSFLQGLLKQLACLWPLIYPVHELLEGGRLLSLIESCYDNFTFPVTTSILAIWSPIFPDVFCRMKPSARLPHLPGFNDDY